VPKCPRHFGTGAEVSRRHSNFFVGAEESIHFGTSAEMSWVRSVFGPKCLYTDNRILPDVGKYYVGPVVAGSRFSVRGKRSL